MAESKLREAYAVLTYLRSKINEVNLLREIIPGQNNSLSSLHSIEKTRQGWQPRVFRPGWKTHTSGFNRLILVVWVVDIPLNHGS
jgi:hypothetical protein